MINPLFSFEQSSLPNGHCPSMAALHLIESQKASKTHNNGIPLPPRQWQSPPRPSPPLRSPFRISSLPRIPSFRFTPISNHPLIFLSTLHSLIHGVPNPQPLSSLTPTAAASSLRIPHHLLLQRPIVWPRSSSMMS